MASQSAHSAKHAVLVLVTVDDCSAHSFITQPLLLKVASVVVGPCNARHQICSHSELCVACNVMPLQQTRPRQPWPRLPHLRPLHLHTTKPPDPERAPAAMALLEHAAPPAMHVHTCFTCKQGQKVMNPWYLHVLAQSCDIPSQERSTGAEGTCRSPKRSSFSGVPRCATSCLCRASLASASAVSLASSSSLNDVTVTPRRRRTALNIPVSETNRLNTRYRVRDASVRSQKLINWVAHVNTAERYISSNLAR